MGIQRCVALATLAMVTMSPTGRRLEATNEYQGDCIAHLDGRVFPQLVPEYSVWEDLFGRVQAGKEASHLPQIRAELQLSETGMNVVVSASTAALSRASALKSSVVPPRGVSRNTAAADTILENRDDLLRSLSPADVQRLVEHTGVRRRQARYAFAKPGRRAINSTQGLNCPVSVNGKVDAELIPEAYYWEFHLRLLASISETHRIGIDKYDQDYLDTLRQQRLPIPETEVVLVLKSAVQAIAEIDALRTARSIAGDDRNAVEALVADEVEAARLNLLRRLSKSSWLVVQRDAANRRGGITYDFPTGF